MISRESLSGYTSTLHEEQMTKRDTALTYAKIAGYHGDTKSLTRLAIESRVNLPALRDAFYTGQQARVGGVKCNCYECKNGTK